MRNAGDVLRLMSGSAGGTTENKDDGNRSSFRLRQSNDQRETRPTQRRSATMEKKRINRTDSSGSVPLQRSICS